MYSWDIITLRGPTKWTDSSLYLILNVFSRCAIGPSVQHREWGHVG